MIQKWLLGCAIFAMTLFLVAILHSTFFYHYDGDAAHAFSYNLSFFVPLTFTAIVISFFVSAITLIMWKKLPGLKGKIITLCLALPILLLFLIQLFSILRAR